ncbi:MAG: hypothetical protein P8J20_01140 [Novosphingobium sp.]|nr:hypothetical protein [Novosphingobium sp.]
MAQDPNPDHDRIKRSRNMVMALALGGFVILVYFISIAKMG